MNVDGRRTLILGLAREGVSLARFLAARGVRVTATDAAPAERLDQAALRDLPVRLVLGGDHPELVDEADVLYVSPGVPESNSVYQAAVRRGLPVGSATTVFFDLCPAPIVGVTGTSGKTTTTGLIGHILRGAGRDVVVGGNIGDPMLDLLPRVGQETDVVLELSSFQLSLLRRSPHLAVVTNISPNHLDRHGTMEAYVAAKRHIVEHQTTANRVVLNGDDAWSADFASATPAQVYWFRATPDRRSLAGVCDGTVGVIREGEFVPVLPVSDIPLLGRHNVENVLAAVAAAAVLGVKPEAMAEAIRTFRPAPHRLQTVGERHGVRFIDDSIATSPSRAAVALEAIGAPVLLIAGGRDKRVPWDEFAALAVQKARAIFLIGEAAADIERAVRRSLGERSGELSEDAIVRCDSLPQAVRAAGAMAKPGDVVLLSPGCASYDMFADFEERGAVFARTVEALDAA